jgi:hypothetical protein
MTYKIANCQHCLRDYDECDAFPCADEIDKREAAANPFYDANGCWQEQPQLVNQLLARWDHP